MSDLTTASSSPTTQTRRQGAYPETGSGLSQELARPLRRRRGLPSGRAVVGGLLVIIAAVGVFAAYTDATAGPDTRWVVARRAIIPGQRLAAADLGVIAIELPVEMQARAFIEDNAESLIGAVAVAPIAPAELVEASDVVRSGAGVTAPEEISFPIGVDRAVGGTLQPGELVDVLATYGGEGDSCTLAVVTRARLLRRSEGGEGLTAPNSIVLTLGLDAPQQSLAVADAVNNGEVIVVRTTAAGPDPSSGGCYRPLAGGAPAAGAGDD